MILVACQLLFGSSDIHKILIVNNQISDGKECRLAVSYFNDRDTQILFSNFFLNNWFGSSAQAIEQFKKS